MHTLQNIIRRKDPWILHNFNNGGLDKFRAAKANLEAGNNAIYNVVVISDSSGEGYMADESSPLNNIANGYVGLLNSAFASRYQDLGTGFLPVFALSGASEHPWSFDANWTWLDGGYGIVGDHYVAMTTGSVATFNFNGTGVVVTAVRGDACGSFAASIDSVSKGTFNTYKTGEIDGAEDFVIAAAGTLSDGNHTLTITTSSSAVVLLVGAYPLTNNTRGMRVIRCCKYGTTVANYTWAGSGYVMFAEIDHWTPILTIIALIANDAAGTNISTYKTEIQRLITKGKEFGDVLIYANYPRPDYAGSINLPYVAALKELSDVNNVPMIDLCTPYADKTKPYNLMASDNTHPNANGQELMFRPLKAVLF